MKVLIRIRSTVNFLHTKLLYQSRCIMTAETEVYVQGYIHIHLTGFNLEHSQDHTPDQESYSLLSVVRHCF